MSAADWTVLLATLALIFAYGVWKGRRQQGMEAYLLAGRQASWWVVAVSIMATQASAITFLSTTGQGYADGMRFVQFYFGLPIAMVVLCATVVPIYARLRVFTAYEYLETRFDLKTRALAATLFLVQRGLAVGLTIAAPAIVLSVVLGLRLSTTTLLTGGLAVVYTTFGGTKAVSQTHFQQMLVILAGMAIALFITIHRLPPDVSIVDAARVAGISGRMRAVDVSFDWKEKYNLWSGLIGGCFLALSYFGTDQSQVQRYLTARNVTQSRLALLFNGALKVPMQFGILFVGVMVFASYHFVEPPLYFNVAATRQIAQGPNAGELRRLEEEHHEAFETRRADVQSFLAAERVGEEPALTFARLRVADDQRALSSIHARAVDLVRRDDPTASDVNYVFLRFVLDHLPTGIIGLVLAAVFCAAMGSSASELNALASTSVVDVYRRCIRKDATPEHYVRAARVATLLWGAVAVGFAQFATSLGTLVEAVNVLGSLFYGTILGIFAVAFALPRVGGTAVFVSAIAAEAVVVALFLAGGLAFLWLNVVGCVLVVLLSLVTSAATSRARLAPGP